MEKIKEYLKSEKEKFILGYPLNNNAYDCGHIDGKLELIDRLLAVIKGEECKEGN